MRAFGKLLREDRNRWRHPEDGGRLTQAELAHRLNCTEALVGHWETGRRAIDANDRTLLLKLLTVLCEGGGVKKKVEADNLLQAGNYPTLSDQEWEAICIDNKQQETLSAEHQRSEFLPEDILGPAKVPLSGGETTSPPNIPSEKIKIGKNVTQGNQTIHQGNIIYNTYNTRPEPAVSMQAPQKSSPTPKISEMKPQQDVPLVPFVDRIEHLGKILDPLGPPYYFLDAPAGYGKTMFLLELKGRALDKGWVCAYICADDYFSSATLIRGLAQELGLQGDFSGSNSSDSRQLGSSLGGMLRQQRGEDIKRVGVMLLIDLGRGVSLDLIKDLVNMFIPGVRSNLQMVRIPFRVVLAGRHLAKQKEMIETSVPLTVEQLVPLTYDALREVTKEYLSGPAISLDDNDITQMAAGIMHLSGGHPGCMAEILTLYKRVYEPLPSEFFNWKEAEIQHVINQEISQLQEGISSELQSIFNTLGVFRQLNTTILRILMDDKGGLTGYNNVTELRDKLTTGYYLKPDGMILRNDNHRLWGLQLRQDPKHAQIAKESYDRYLDNPPVPKPEVWVVDYLYQFLQCFSNEIGDPGKRKEIGQKLLDKEVPYILGKLIRNRPGVPPIEIHQELETVLRRDDEFHFVVNYYTRGYQYSNDPYATLIDKIKEFFDIRE